MWSRRSKNIEDLFVIKVKLLSSKTNCYNCKMFYVSPMVITKKIPIEDTQ